MNDSTLATEQHDFGAEVGRLLDLVVHSLYSEREIFLRELVANAADAMDRRRFEALTNPAVAPPADAKIRLVPDKQARTLLIADEGIGMTRQELIDNLGTIARSGTRLFGETLAEAKPEDRPNLIGQFGVGFYSAFMVADRVEVTSRKAGAEEAFTWSSDGSGLHPRPGDARDRRHRHRAAHQGGRRGLPRSDPARRDRAQMGRPHHRADHHRAGRQGPAGERGHRAVAQGQVRGDGAQLPRILPPSRPFLRHAVGDAALEGRGHAGILRPAVHPRRQAVRAVEADRESHVRLHVRRMFITDKAELLPHWLRFVQGVVDTEDLPLNVSREMLQATPVLARIRKALIGRVLGELKTRAKEAPGEAHGDAPKEAPGGANDYAKFWENFGAWLKEGIWEDAEHRAELAPLLRFQSSTRDGLTGFADYVGRMQAGQEAIYYLTGDDAAALKTSPQLEGFRAKGFEVLLLPDPIDAFWPERMDTFEGKPLRSVTQAVDDLGKDADLPDISLLTSALKAALEGEVSEVRATARLTDSAVVLAAADKGPDLQMQRLMRRAGRTMMPSLPVLEVNPTHPLIARLAERHADKEVIAGVATTLLELARVQEGDLPKDPAGFARRVTALLAGSLAAAG